MVHGGRLELPCPCGHQFLRLACLPIPPAVHVGTQSESRTCKPVMGVGPSDRCVYHFTIYAYWRRQQDLNLRAGQALLPVFQTGPFSLLGMSPYGGSEMLGKLLVTPVQHCFVPGVGRRCCLSVIRNEQPGNTAEIRKSVYVAQKPAALYQGSITAFQAYIRKNRLTEGRYKDFPYHRP